MGDLTAHFSRHEFACQCGCGYDDINMELVYILETIRVAIGRPITITSGCRCVEWNQEVGGTSNSAHLTGDAADLKTQGSLQRAEYLDNAWRLGVRRIGFANSFTHVDIADNHPTPRIWLY